jgi:hypothetical protein
VLSEEVEGAEVGWYVRLHVRGVGTQLYESLQGLVWFYVKFFFSYAIFLGLLLPHAAGKWSYLNLMGS